MIKPLPPLQKNEEDVSYDVDSLFTNISLKETIDYIIHKICNHKTLHSINDLLTTYTAKETQQKSQQDVLFEALNNFHPNITIEVKLL